MYIHDRNYFNQTKRTCMAMYENRKFSNHIALCYDYMSGTCSDDEAIINVGFVNTCTIQYLTCIFFFYSFRRGTDRLGFSFPICGSKFSNDVVASSS